MNEYIDLRGFGRVRNRARKLIDEFRTTERRFGIEEGIKAPDFSLSAAVMSWARGCGFEDLETDKQYDLVLFSESFQYVRLSSSLTNVARYLADGGHLLICDFFKTDAPGKSALGGGHRLSRFNALMEEQPFDRLEDIDITEQTAPNLDLVSDMTESVGKPLWELFNYYLDNNRPFLSKLLKWKYKKKIVRIEERYFGGTRNGEEFKKHKSYRLLLFRKKS